jgi:hypothetical protein
MTNPTTGETTEPLDPRLAELLPLYRDAESMTKRFMSRLWHAWARCDAEEVRWLHKQALSVERRSQEREA